MILPKTRDAIHKAWLYRVLINLIDDPFIGKNIFFKGGTCASMLGYLDRFSVDLDFDLKKGADKEKLDKKINKIMVGINLIVVKQSREAMLYALKYHVPKGQRNTVKLDIIDSDTKANVYKPQYLAEIDRYANCQTIETMFAHKLVSVIDRYEKYKTIAGRDAYDIHYFFTHGFGFSREVIMERTGMNPESYFQRLITFIKVKVTQRILDQDLNTLLTREKFDSIRQTLKTEVLILLQDELKRRN